MREFWKVATAVVVLAASSPAVAEDFKANAGQSYVLDLDTQTGNFSVWQVSDLSGANALRSQVTFARLGTDAKWAATFQVALQRGDERAVLSITGVPGKSILLPMLETWRGGKKAAEELFVMAPAPAEKFALEVTWTEQGLVTFVLRDKAAQSINGLEKRTAQLSGPPASLRISGSTGEVEFNPLEIGRQSP